MQIGLNVPYSFGNNMMGADDVLQKCVQLGVSAVELRSQPVEGFLGVPADLAGAKQRPRVDAGCGRREESRKRAAAKVATRRADVNKVHELRARSTRTPACGLKSSNSMASTRRADDEIDYCFELAKALGGARDLVRDLSARTRNASVSSPTSTG